MTDSLSKKQVTLEITSHVLLMSLTLVILFKLLPTITPVFQWIGFILILFIAITDCFFLIKMNRQFLKITRRLLIYLVAVCMLIIATFYLTKLLVLTDMYGFEQLLQLHESTAKWIYLAICFAQPIILPLPEVITTGGASSVFGPVTAIYLGFIGTLSGIVVMYFIARIGGQRIVSRFVKKKQLVKYQKYVQRNEMLFVVIMFVIPILPDEIICIGAGLSGFRFSKFLIVAAVSKLFTTTIFAYSTILAKEFSVTNVELLVYTSLFVGVLFLLSLARKKVVKER
ncbi:TVP38/TMEM64 family protein [Fictibacillus norfolkensis]|uniref:VTT domain-containing protein n=1 Tax=Fictibacillus norfolkensis TaxID=2762233 RepID=A0ABR8SK89_9BACL|nr:VTT domain-containing protein [Fictibacillus norfolkensis]MBD7963897.1 VTT domain-containing protein [Fictibacillus norfolkensis]